MKELSKEKQLQINGGSIYAISLACIFASVSVYRLLKRARINIVKLARRY